MVKEAHTGIVIAFIWYFSLILVEFIILLFGVSVMYKKINTIQLLAHGFGAFYGIWMILDGWHWASLFIMSIPFGLVPFILEFSVVFSVIRFRQINSHIENQKKAVLDDRKKARL